MPATGAVLLSLLPASASARDKTDVVVLRNGDHITGEIMAVSRGKLDYKTDDAGRLSIEWLKVERVTSLHTYEIQTADRTKYYSALRAPPEEVTGVVELDDGRTIPVPDVVAIVPLDAGLWSRMSAYFDLGFTLAKSNNAMTLNTDGFVGYRGERLGASFQFDTYLQGADNTATVVNTSGEVIGDAYFGAWTTQLSVQAQKNDELDLKLRLTLGGGAAYSAIRSNFMELLAKAGLAAAREQYSTGGPTWYLTGYLAGTWDIFQYDSPKLDAGISVTAYPYLTDLGRVRVETTLRVKYEVFKDFNVGLNFSDTFDSRPPDATPNNDYLVSVTIGWKYRR